MSLPTRPKPWIIALSAGGLAVAAVCVFAAVYTLSGPTTPDGPPVTITACDHRGDETRVGFEVTNTGTEEASYRLRFRILDAGGREISKGSEYTGTVDPGGTDTDAITLRHVGREGATCEYLGVE